MSRCTPFAADFRAVRAFAPAILSISSMKMMPGLLDTVDRGARDAVHVDQLLLFFLGEVLERFGHLQLALLRLALETGPAACPSG
jgi:hypothetical protein